MIADPRASPQRRPDRPRGVRSGGGAAARKAAPVVIAGVTVDAQASRAGEENASIGLPDGWSAQWSNSKAAWYWRSEAGETTWTKPSPKKADRLPEGWAATWSDEHNAEYFVHEASGETTWTRP